MMEAALAPGERMMGGEIVGESGLAGQQVAPLIPDLTASLKTRSASASYWGTNSVCTHDTLESDNPWLLLFEAAS